jgi:hypothetical protein
MKWNDLEGKTIKIWVNGRDGKVLYSTTLSNKKQDGSYENMYIDVQIPKNAVINNGDEVTIQKGFISFYKTKDGLPKVKIVILEVEQESYSFDNDTELPF